MGTQTLGDVCMQMPACTISPGRSLACSSLAATYHHECRANVSLYLACFVLSPLFAAGKTRLVPNTRRMSRAYNASRRDPCWGEIVPNRQRSSMAHVDSIYDTFLVELRKGPPSRKISETGHWKQFLLF